MRLEPASPVRAASRCRRVLMTADAVGGVWRYSIDLAAALRGRGIATTLAVLGPPPAPGQRREAEGAGVELHENGLRLEWMDGGDADLRPAGEWLLDLAATVRPDVVHLNGYAHAALPWDRPTVVVAHSCVCSWWRAVKREPVPSRYASYTRHVIAGLRAADVVVAPSAAMLAMLADEYEPLANARVIANGRPLGGPRRPAARKAPLVLSAGRLWDEAKNVAALSAAARSISWPVYVAGDPQGPAGGPDPLPGVRALGRLSAAQMRRWYRKAAIYALPARYEPFGLSVLEAASAGAALVLGDIASLRENWDGAAVFVAPDDHAALAGAIGGLIADDRRRAELGRAAAERAEGFDIAATADEYVSLYESVL